MKEFRQQNKKHRKNLLVVAIFIVIAVGPSIILALMGMRLPKLGIWFAAFFFIMLIALCFWGIRNINREL